MRTRLIQLMERKLMYPIEQALFRSFIHEGHCRCAWYNGLFAWLWEWAEEVLSSLCWGSCWELFQNADSHEIKIRSYLQMLVFVKLVREMLLFRVSVFTARCSSTWQCHLWSSFLCFFPMNKPVISAVKLWWKLKKLFCCYYFS